MSKQVTFTVEVHLADADVDRMVGIEVFPGSAARYGPHPEDIDVDPPVSMYDEVLTTLANRLSETARGYLTTLERAHAPQTDPHVIVQEHRGPGHWTFSEAWSVDDETGEPF